MKKNRQADKSYDPDNLRRVMEDTDPQRRNVVYAICIRQSLLGPDGSDGLADLVAGGPDLFKRTMRAQLEAHGLSRLFDDDAIGVVFGRLQRQYEDEHGRRLRRVH